MNALGSVIERPCQSPDHQKAARTKVIAFESSGYVPVVTNGNLVTDQVCLLIPEFCRFFVL